MVQTVSILTPTHNRAELLARMLQSLAQMERPAEIAVEVIVVANACTDQTVESVTALVATMPFSLRCVEEPMVGVSHARNRAVREARGDLFAFVDDDMCVSPRWLIGILDVFDTHPAEMVSGKTILWWEAVARPAWMDRRAEHLLSCVDYGDQVIELKEPGLAISANFAVKREVFDRLGAERKGEGGGGFANLGRTPQSPLSGEDTEFFARALDAGYRMFYAPVAEAKHWVAPHRITLKYLSAVAFSNGLVRPYLRKSRSRAEAWRTLAEYSFRWTVYGVLGVCARILCRKKDQVNQQIRRRTCWGNVLGTYRRMRGLSPTGEPTS